MNNDKVIREVILNESWTVREVYGDLLLGIYKEYGLKLPEGDYSLPLNYFNAIIMVLRSTGDIAEVQLERINKVLNLLIEDSVGYYISNCDRIHLDLEKDPLMSVVLQGCDVYHSVIHNVMVASYAMILKTLNPEMYYMTGKELEILILTTLFHDSIKSSDSNKEMAKWDDDTVVSILDQVYSVNTRNEIIDSVLLNVAYTDYTNPECAFYVDFAPGSSNVKIDWDNISPSGKLIVISDWLAQTVFVDRRDRNRMVSYLYQYWLVITGKDKTHEFPIKISVFKAVIECLLQMPQLFLIDDKMIQDLKEELLYFQDTKTTSVRCFGTKKELNSMGISDALKLMYSYLG
jgi:hypothetical protein